METKLILSERTRKTGQLAKISNEFLRRIERQRLENECLLPLDLRSHVTGPCKHFSYRGRSLWLNTVAHQLFLEGLNNNAGVFTVETYESILKRCVGDPDNFTQAMANGIRNKQRDELHIVTKRETTTLFETDQTYNKFVIDLSYFERRVYNRYKIPLILILICKGQTYTAETRDISQNGLQLRLNMPIDVSVNDTVIIDVTPLVEHQLEHPEIQYRVVRIRRLLNDTLLGLQCIENEVKDGLTVISGHIATASQTALTEHTDPEDALLTAQALLAERFYMRSTSILPFFLFERQDNNSPLSIIFNNHVNQRCLDVFKNSQGCYDFSSLVTPSRIKLLTRLALRDSKADTLIVVYRSKQHAAPQVRADLECKNFKHWCRLLMQYANQPGFRIFKVVARVAHRPVDMRIEDALKPLSDSDNKFANRLLTEAKSLSIIGALIDVTEQCNNLNDHNISINSCSLEPPVIYRVDERPYAPPTLLPIHYIQENRSENRYLGKIQVEVIIAGLLYKGVTRDVSPHGLSIKLEDPYVSFISHRQATISFPKLEAHSSSLTRNKGSFRNVPAELVSGPLEGEKLLHFKICDTNKGQQFSNAFSALLAKRRSDLSIETSHTLRAATSRLYSSIFIESSSTLPLFIYRGSHNDWTFRLGISTSPTPLIDYFEVADGKFDFSVFTSNGRLQRIMQQVSKSGSSEITLYLCKERLKNSPAFEIRSLADFEITDKAVQRQFVNHVINHEFRCIKIIVNKPDIPPKAEIEQAIERLVQLSPSRSERLKSEFQNLIAIGDILDITGLVVDLWSKNPY